MAKSSKRFIETYTQGTLDVMRVIVDKETGVNYLHVSNGYASGLSPLLDASGKPVVTSVFDEE